jgi:hypothetical protein
MALWRAGLRAARMQSGARLIASAHPWLNHCSTMPPKGLSQPALLGDPAAQPCLVNAKGVL